MSPRRTVEINALLILKIRNAGERNVEYKAELYVSRRDKDQIRELLLVTGLDSVNILDIRDKPEPRWNQPKSELF